jgi:HD-GYP domain-containing protein (c-di-GMP phosphodiesterase class II)
VNAPDIPIQTRMMTISDIFDALTASDRPYKRAVPLQRALDIMQAEVKGGMLDGELFKLFTEGKVFEKLAG